PGVSLDGDSLVGFDPVDEVARHARREVRSPDHDCDSARSSGQKQRGLSSGVAAPGDHHGRPRARSGLQLGRGVVHAAGLELLEPDGIEPPVARSGRDDDCPTSDIGTVGRAKHEMAGFLPKRYRRARAAERCAELLGLDRGPLREVPSRDASREAQVVFVLELDPAWPPTATISRTSVRSPSEAPYIAAASPAGPAPTTIRSKQRSGSFATVNPR